MEVKMEEAQWSVSEKERQVARLQDQEKALHASFSEAIGENKFKDFLFKVSKHGWEVYPDCSLVPSLRAWERG